jgi:4-hydroxybenzoate polyprenyltransferase
MRKLIGFIHLLRPFHWSKNIFVFAALIFARQNQLFSVEKIGQTLYAFVCFCLLSSVVYVMNDIHDVDYDRQHPKKRFRPIAAGVISIPEAWILAGLLFIIGLGGSFSLNILLGLVATTYLLLNILYSWWLKHHVIVDVMCIAIGFVLRAMAGVVAIEVPLSPWLLVCTFTLCLFVGFGKRRCELAVTNNDYQIASDRRPVLERYTLELLSHLLTISAALAVTTFLLYTMDDQTAQKFGTNYLIYSSPFVIYGVFRFAALIQTGRFGGPMEIFAADRPFQMAILLWLIMVIIIVHWGPAIQTFVHKLAVLY